MTEDMMDRAGAIGAMYRHLLGRPGDPEGIDYHLQSLSNVADREVIERLLSGFTASGEFRRGALMRSLRASELAALPDLDIMGLGTHCFVSGMLKSLGLKRFSLPFDWINSSPEMILHTLDDDFATFLDRQHYQFVAPAQRPDPLHYIAHHGYYLDRFADAWTFNHHDPVHSEQDYGYFQRAVRRFRTVQSGPGRRAYVLVNQDRRPASADRLQTYRTLVERLDADFCLFIDVLCHGGPTGSYQVQDVGGRYEIATYGSRSVMTAAAFPDDIDLVELASLVERRMRAVFLPA